MRYLVDMLMVKKIRSEYYKFSNARYVGSEGYKVWRRKYICLRTNTLICIYLHCGNGRPSQITVQFPPSSSLALNNKQNEVIK